MRKQTETKWCNASSKNTKRAQSACEREQREATGVAPLKPLSLAEHQELVTVTIPQQLLPKIDFETTFVLGPHFEEVSNAVPGAAGRRVCVLPEVGGWVGCGGQLGWRQGTEQEGQPGATA